MDILENLNQEQIKAVKHGKGPLLIVAGAGTGKTTVITRKIAYLIEKKIASADEILAMTFTEKAAAEMEERVEMLLPLGFVDLWVSTFHSFGERILKDNALEIGLPNNFKLLNQSQQAILIRKHLDEFDLDYYRPLGNPTKFVKALVTHFSRLKDEDISTSEYLKYAEELNLNLDQQFTKRKKKNLTDTEKAQVDEALKISELANAYHVYNKILLDNQSLDFGDLILYTIKLFKDRPSILEKYRKQFKYVLIDEFQDTNYAQYDLIKLLASPDNNLTVCGDDDQSVFKFRGASISNILQFKKDYAKSEEVVLIKNYRSGQKILDLAYNFIQLNNPDRLEVALKNKVSKRLKSEVKINSEINTIFTSTAGEEARAVVEKIIELKKKDKEANWSDFAILIRANDQSEIFISYLEKADLPYTFLASKGLFLKPIIIDLISYLKLLDNYHESRAFFSVLNISNFNISSEDIVNISEYANRFYMSLYEVAKKVRAIRNISKPGIAGMEKLLSLIEKHTVLAKEKTVGQVLMSFLEDSGLLQELTNYRVENIKAVEKVGYVSKFFNQIDKFEQSEDDKSVRNFISQLDLQLEAGESGELSSTLNQGPDSIKITTIHGAKGLEFKYVFLVQLVDKRFPTIERKENILIPDELVKEVLPSGNIHVQEERRLFYVAITRAKNNLYLTMAEDYGGMRRKKPSRFLYESQIIKAAEKQKAIPTGAVDFSIKKSLGKSKEDIVLLKHLPKNFSFSQLKAYKTCPYQYRLGFVLRIPRRGKAPFSFGKTMHNTLYRFFQLSKNKRNLEQNSLFKDNKQQLERIKKNSKLTLVLDDLLDLYEKEWIAEWYASKEEERKYKKTGREILENFYKIHQDDWPDVLFLEKAFNFKVGDHLIKGMIDRVDVIKGKQVEIIDYKTGSVPKSKSMADFEQLLIYAYALKNILKLEPVKLSYYYLNENKKITHEHNDNDLKILEDWITDLIEKIKKADFIATPGWHCQYCDFFAICPYRSK